MTLLKFSTGNGKLSNRLIFSLPAGYSCPHAGVCKTLADRTTGAITDLPQHTGTEADEFRCFAAMAETRPSVRNARWHNWDLLRETMYGDNYSYEQQVELIAGLKTSMFPCISAINCLAIVIPKPVPGISVFACTPR